MKPEETQTSFRLPNDQLAELDEVAQLIGVTRAELIRRACSVYLWQTRYVRDDLRSGRGGVWRRIFGPPVKIINDESDEQLAAAFRSFAARTKDTLPQVAPA